MMRLGRLLCLAVLAALSAPGIVTAQEDGAETKARSKVDPKATAKLQKATFGGGCFWCLEAVFERIPGVKAVVSGYAGGHVQKPTYKQVCTGQTGHAEVVQIQYDPEVVTYDKLLEVFFACHDPTTPNRQGPDYGPQYRSIILFEDDAQRAASQAMIENLGVNGAFSDPIVTELVPLNKFFAAEAYHQDYYRKNKNAPYCRMTIAPKLDKLKLKP